MNKVILSGINDDVEELHKGDEDEIDQCYDMHLINTSPSLIAVSDGQSNINNVNNNSSTGKSENEMYLLPNSFSSLHKDNLPFSPLLPSYQSISTNKPDERLNANPNCNTSVNNTNSSNESSLSPLFKSSPEQCCDSGYDDADKSSINSKISPIKNLNAETDVNSPDVEIEKLRKIISEKEKQLEIAAQYGISLLQKNEELQLLVDLSSADDVRSKLDQLTNEKHQMKMQQESTNQEYEVIINDLRNDLLTLGRSFEDERKVWKQTEKEFAIKIEELMLCNEQLSEQILNASLTEEEARNQMTSLKLRVTENEIEQNGYVDSLQNEILETRSEMDRMIQLKSNECKLLSCALDENQNKINQLEREKDIEYNKVQQLQDELLKLEDKYVILLSKIESPNQSQFMMGGHNLNEASLFAELDILSDAFDSNGKLYGKAVIGVQLRQEILEVYRQIHRLTLEVKGQGQMWSPEVVDICDLKAGQLLLALSELQDLITRRFHLGGLPPLNDEQSRLEAQVSYLKEQSNILKDQLNCNKMTLNRVKEELTNRDNQLERSLQEKAGLETLISELKHNITTLQKRYDELRETKLTGNPDDLNIVREFQIERDTAIAREHDLHNQLLQTKLDMVELDRQLMEAVEHKLQLSNQLEAWQNDMHDLIEDKMASEIARDKMRGTIKQQSSSSLLPPPPSSLSSSSSLLARPKSFKMKLFPRWS